MKKLTALLCLASCSVALAKSPTYQPEEQMKVATPQKSISVQRAPAAEQHFSFSFEQLQQDQALTEKLLNIAIGQNSAELIEKLLPIYRTFATHDPILLQFAQALLAKSQGDYGKAISELRHILAQRPELESIRLDLAIALFEDQQNEAAENLFRQVQSSANLPAVVQQQIETYLNALQQRDTWDMSASVYYIRDKNVYKTSPSPTFDSVQLKNIKKGESMLPVKAHGFGYAFNLSRHFNLQGSHYLTVENNLYGKLFWDERDADEINNRTSLGYANKSAVQTVQISPFYERSWSGGERYSKSWGLRLDYSRWLNANWQLSNALEYSKNRYIDNQELEGSSQFVSSTLFWQYSPTQFFYSGIDVYNNKAREKSNAYLLKSVRFGWGKSWQWGISSRVNFSYSQKKYKDEARLSYLDLGEIRKDKIYRVSLTLWKSDWHLWHITPKLQLSWRKQQSNIADLYSYKEQNANLIFEKTF